MKTTKTILLILVALLIGNCTTQSPAVSGDTATVAPQASYTLMPNIKPSKTNTSTSIPPAPTWTPIPTLPASEAKNELMRLLDKNSCKFPCLWEISPGVTKINDVRNLSRYSAFPGSYVDFSESGGLLFLRVPQANNQLINIVLEIEIVNGVVDEMAFVTQLLQKTDDGYESILGNQNYADTTKGFSMSSILIQYGTPSNVNIYTWSTVPLGNSWDFHILLFFPANGFAVDYTADVVKMRENNLLGCPSTAFSSFWFWDPSTKVVTFQNVLEKYHLRNSKPIETASTLNVQDFYTYFREPGINKCIETPKNIWPLP